MTDFNEKGFAYVELFDPKFASDAWEDVDKDEIRGLLDQVSNQPWKALTFPKTRNFLAFVQEVDKVSNIALFNRLHQYLFSRTCTSAGNDTAKGS